MVAFLGLSNFSQISKKKFCDFVLFAKFKEVTQWRNKKKKEHRIRTQEQFQQSPWLMRHSENVVFPRLSRKVGFYHWKYSFHTFFCTCKYIQAWSHNLGHAFPTGAAFSEMSPAVLSNDILQSCIIAKSYIYLLSIWAALFAFKWRWILTCCFQLE